MADARRHTGSRLHPVGDSHCLSFVIVLVRTSVGDSSSVFIVLIKVHRGFNYSRLSGSRVIDCLPLPLKHLVWIPALASPNFLDGEFMDLGIWASAMKLALQIKHKIGFINGTCNRSVYLVGAPLLEEYDSCNVVARAELIDHGKLLRLMQFLMGLDDVYQAIRSSILTKKILPEVKDAFVIVSWEESQRGFLLVLCFEISGCPPSFKRNPNLKPASNFNNNKSNNAYAKGRFMGNNDITSSISPLSLSNEHILKLTSLLNDKSYTPANANMAVDVSDLKLTVGHPIGTLAKITHVGNLKLNNDVILFDVLVIPEYTDLRKGKVMGTGSEFIGLYLFNKEYNVSASVNKSEYFACHVSKDVWHNRLGHLGFLPLFLNGKSPFSLVYGREPNLYH
ncbi:ribonuclease H-like domain-containing protein [Tanacetum coccineum]